MRTRVGGRHGVPAPGVLLAVAVAVALGSGPPAFGRASAPPDAQAVAPTGTSRPGTSHPGGGQAGTDRLPSARFASGPIHGAGFMTVTAELPSGRLVAGGDSQGFFVSDDGGRSWLSRNVLRGGADPFASRGVASLVSTAVNGPSGPVPTLFAAVGKRDPAAAAILRSDDEGETWVVDDGGKGIWFDGGNLPGASSTRSRATSRLVAVADRGPYAAQPWLFAGDMTGCVWSRALTTGAAWAMIGCLPDASRSPIRGVAISGSGDVIVATSRMGLAGSRGGGTLPQPAQAGAWRFVIDPACTAGPCGHWPPAAPLILFAAAAESVEEVIVTGDDHLYVAVVDDRFVGMPARLGGLWAGRPDGSPLVSVGALGLDSLRNVVTVDVVTGSPSAETVLTGASLPKAAATDIERTDYEVSRVRVRWDTGPFPAVEAIEPLAQSEAVDLTLYGHEGLVWFVDGTSTLGNEQYVVSSLQVLSDGRYLVSGKAGLWMHHPRPPVDGQVPPPWRPAVFGIGSTFQGDVALASGTVFSTDADRFLFRADLTVPNPPVRHELDQPRTVALEVTKGLSVTVLADGTAIAGEATPTFGGLLLAVPPGDGPSMQIPLPVDRQPMALARVGDTVLVGIANNGLWSARWDGVNLVEWRRLTVPGLGFPTPQPFETAVLLPDDVSPAAATIHPLTQGGETVLVVETGAEGLWVAPWVEATAPLSWTQVAPSAGIAGGEGREVAYVRTADALFLTAPGSLSRIDRPARCVAEACAMVPVTVPVVGATGWTPLSTSYGAVPLAADADTLFVVAGADPTLDKPGTVFRFDPSSEDVAAWRQMADPDGVAANQLIRPIAVAAEAGRLAITTSGNGLVVYD